MRHAPLPLELAANAALALGPLLLAQGRLVRRRAPRLPGALGPAAGRVDGREPALRLLVLGESTVAGVGADSHEEALAGQLAHALAAHTGRAVEWRAAGQIGATAHEALTLLSSVPATPVDATLVALGVNDSLRLHSPRRWTADLTPLSRPSESGSDRRRSFWPPCRRWGASPPYHSRCAACSACAPARSTPPAPGSPQACPG